MQTLLLFVLFLSVAYGSSILSWFHRPHKYIVNGEPAEEGEFPFVVSLQNDGKHLCGGTILDEETILTGAHCVGIISSSNVKIVAGVTNLNDGGGDRQEIEVSKFITHENFNMYSYSYDIALLKLEQKLTFNKHVSAVQLPEEPIKSIHGIVTGWGATFESGPNSDKLLKAPLLIITQEECREVFGEDADVGVFCANSYLRNEDACQGDSGGPFLCNSKLCGIISAGVSCGMDEPSLYSDVFYFLDWIKDHRN